jgi:hypothetical protein
VQIVPFGSDLLRPNQASHFQLPYIYYHSGGGPDWLAIADGDATAANTDQLKHPIDEFQYQAFGRINPWQDDAKPGRIEPDWRKYHTLVANQLRHCAHMYQDDWSHAVDHPVVSFYDSRFESSDFSDGETAIFQGSDLSTTKLDQHCAWGAALGCATPGSRASLPTATYAGVDALSLVSMLGTTQQCPAALPAADAKFYDDGTSAYVSCQKPLPQHDLRPDYVALMRYLTGIDANDVAVRSPGLWPYATDYAVTATGVDAPFASGNKSLVVNKRTPLVIVTHRAPTDAERDAIAAIIADSSGDPDVADPPKENWGSRRIIVVFMPANQQELNNLDNLRAAFKTRYDYQADPCDGPCRADSEFRNILFVLDPSDDNNGDTTAFCSFGSCNDNNFRDFWLEMYAEGGSGTGIVLPEEYGIDSLASQVFHKIVADEQRKF